MTTKVTYAELVEVLTKVVEERPGYVYKADERDKANARGESVECVYFEHGAPSCVVGHVMSRLGLDVDDLVVPSTFSDHAPFSINESFGAGALLARGVLSTDDDERARELLVVVQSMQDEGAPWGVALQGGLSRVRQLFPEK